MRASKEFLDFLMPELSRFKNPEIPELLEPVDNRFVFALNYNLGGLKFKKQPYVSAIMSAMSHQMEAAKNFRACRAAVEKYMNELPNHSGLTYFFDAVSKIENCVFHAYLSLRYLEVIAKSGNKALFEKNAESTYVRLKHIYNRIKHFDEDIANSLEEEKSVTSYAVWLTDTSIFSTACHRAPVSSITYNELFDIITAVGENLQAILAAVFTDNKAPTD